MSHLELLADSNPRPGGPKPDTVLKKTSRPARFKLHVQKQAFRIYNQFLKQHNVTLFYSFRPELEKYQFRTIENNKFVKENNETYCLVRSLWLIDNVFTCNAGSSWIESWPLCPMQEKTGVTVPWIKSH